MSDLPEYREKELVELICQGNEKAFEEIFKNYYQSLCNFAWIYVRSRAISEELVMDVFLRVWEKKETLDPDKRIRYFLFQSVKNRAIDHLDRKKIADQYLRELSEINMRDQFPRNESLSDEKEIIEEVRKIIEDFPEKTKHIYKLNRMDGLTYREIADVLEISSKSVEYHMSRALDILRSSLSKYLSVIVSVVTKNFFF